MHRLIMKRLDGDYTYTRPQLDVDERPTAYINAVGTLGGLSMCDAAPRDQVWISGAGRCCLAGSWVQCSRRVVARDRRRERSA